MEIDYLIERAAAIILLNPMETGNLLKESNIVNLSIGIQPLEVSIQICESSSPVSSILKLIFNL